MPAEFSFASLPSRARRGGRILAWALVVLAAYAFRERLSLSSASRDRLRFVHSFTTASERAIIDDAVAEFQRAHPELPVDQIAFNSETYQNIGWRLQFQGDRQSDVFFTWLGYKTRQADQEGWSLDMKPYLSAEDLDQFLPSTLGPSSGALTFLPQSVDLSNLIWVNRDCFRTNGLIEPRTRQEWLAVSIELRRRGLLALVQGNREFWPMGNLGAELLGRSVGVESLQDLFMGRIPATPQRLEGLRLLVDWAREGCLDAPGILSPGGIGTLSDLDAKVLFLGGKAAQHPIGSWFTADIRDAKDHGELRFEPGVFSVPPNPGEAEARVAVITGYQVNRRTRHPDLAVDFLRRLLSRKYQERFAALGNLSARKDAVAFTTEPIPRQLLALLARPAAMIPPPDTGYSPERAAVFYEICAKLLLGKLDLDGAARIWTEQQPSLAQKEK
ncbi:MAG: extracellular solute-binding protein [Verrucomicrobia bacterium]|nr:extracellular solute-binding protein [Verrucomicrobiota bacterium]MBI3868141.1 extracellular solute-binding protein [Verrucomicrobiota bacterium]